MPSRGGGHLPRQRAGLAPAKCVSHPSGGLPGAVLLKAERVMNFQRVTSLEEEEAGQELLF